MHCTTVCHINELMLTSLLITILVAVLVESVLFFICRFTRMRIHIHFSIEIRGSGHSYR